MKNKLKQKIYKPKKDYDAMSSIVKAVVNILRDHDYSMKYPGYKKDLKPQVVSLIARAEVFDEKHYSDELALKYWLHDVASILPGLAN